MKITHVISDSNVGGAGVLLCSLAKKLSSHFDIDVIVPYDSALSDRLEGSGAKIKELPMKSDQSFSLSDARGFYKYFEKNRTDFLHTHASLGARLGGALAGIRPCISTRHCAKTAGTAVYMGAAKRMLYDYCTDITVSTADCVAEDLKKEGVRSEKIVTIKNGVEGIARLDESAKGRVRASLGIPNGATVIGCCARLESVKGQDLILRAAASLIRKFPDLYVLLVGDGSAKSTYKLLAARLGILSHVKFTGYVPSPHAYQNIFTVNVNASRGTETSCLATSEALSLGIPTVVSSFGGNTEMIEHGVSGLVFTAGNAFDLENKLTMLLSNAALYRRISDGGYKRWQACFSIDRMAEDYKRLYEQCFDKYKR